MPSKKRPIAGKASFLLLLAACATASCTSGDAQFERNEKQARDNLATEAGAAYDQALGRGIEANPAALADITRCLEKHAGPHDVHGYYHFHAEDDFRVVLRPTTGFSTCLASALEGHAAPAPPSVPYFNPFTFQTAE